MKFIIHPLFLIYAFVLSLMGYFFVMIQYIFCVIFHELAHSFVAKKYGYSLNKIMLMPYGAFLSIEDIGFHNEKEEILVSIAGPLFNIILATFILALWWLFPIAYTFTNIFFWANIITALFNCLPCYPLDGGRVLKCFLRKKFSHSKTKKCLLILNTVFAIGFLIVFVFSIFQVINFNLLIVSSFLIANCFNISRKPIGYSNVSFLSEAQDKLAFGKDVNAVAFSVDSTLLSVIKKTRRSSFNVVYVVFNDGKIKTLSEEMLKRVVLNYSLSTKLSEIF